MQFVVPLEQVADGSEFGINGGHGGHVQQVVVQTLKIGDVNPHVLAKRTIGGFGRFVALYKLEHVADRVLGVLFDGHQMSIDAENVLVKALADQDVLVNLPKVEPGHDEKVHQLVQRDRRQVGQRFADEMIARHILQHLLVDLKGDGQSPEFEDQKGKEQEQKGHDQGNDGGHHVGHGQDLQHGG